MSAPKVLRAVDAGRKPMAGSTPTAGEVARYIVQNVLLEDVLSHIDPAYVDRVVERWLDARVIPPKYRCTACGATGGDDDQAFEFCDDSTIVAIGQDGAG